MSNNFRNIEKLKQEKFKDFQVLLYKCKDIHSFFFQIQGHSWTFKFCTNPVNRDEDLIYRGGLIHLTEIPY